MLIEYKVLAFCYSACEYMLDKCYFISNPNMLLRKCARKIYYHINAN